MNRILLCSTISAVLTGAVTVWLLEDGPPWANRATAQPPGGVGSGAVQPIDVSQPSRPELTPEELTNIRVYEEANRGVVNIVTESRTYDRFFMLPFRSEGAGSGSILDKRGHILTNYHVVDGAQRIDVTLPGGNETFEAELVGRDPENDIAVLKINAPPDELYPLPIGSSDNLRVGQRVYTLGNPFGLEGTLTTGIISNLNRTLPSRVSGRQMKSIIQTDAAMNPGNSGGPLLDTSGRMIGMNVAIASRTGQHSGLGFAIPVNRIRQIVPHLIEHGKVIRADIGIVAVRQLEHGLQIVQMNRGGPAERAGLRGWKTVRRQVSRGPLVYDVERQDPSEADTIIAVDGEPVESASAFVEMIEQRRPGDQVVLTIIRDGERMRVPVVLGAT